MSYLLNKTDGTLLTELIDGRIDTLSTNLTLVGRNYSGFGESFNENFIKLLENFSNTAAPSNPLEGQTWWDRTTARLNVYTGTEWKAAGGPFVQETRPDMVAGDLWIDNARKQLFAYDGSTLILVGPNYSTEQGLSGFQVETVLDTQARAKTVVTLYLNDSLVSVISNEEFTPLDTNIIEELVTINNPTGKIFKGFNVVGKTDQEASDGLSFRFIGIAESTDSLVTPETGEFRGADQFLPSDRNGATTGSLEIKNPVGLKISNSAGQVYNNQRIQGTSFLIENQIPDYDLKLRVRSSAKDSDIANAIYIDAENARVGIFTDDTPQYTLDVNGDTRIIGSLTVEGETITVQSETLLIQDKNIQLATGPGGIAAGDDVTADGGGITLKSSSSNGDKNLIWINATNSWTSNQSFNLSNPVDTYKIAGSEKLTQDSLTNISSAPNLRTIATENGLNFLDIDNINIDENTIYSTGNLIIASDSGLILNFNGNIAIQNSRKIIGAGTPVSAKVAAASGGDLVEDADDVVATKGYTDTENRLEPIALSLDITSLGSGSVRDNNLILYLTELYPVTASHNGKIAKIHTMAYGLTSINLDAAKSIVFVTVDKDGVQNSQSVMRDIGFQNVEYPPPARSLFTFEVQGGAWVRIAAKSYAI